MAESVFLYIGIVIVAGVAAQWIGWRLRIPAIVVLLAVGLTAGPGLRLIDPGVELDTLLRPLVGAAVAIIVFEGGLALNFRELGEAKAGVARLIAIGLPLSWLFGALAAHYVGGLPWSVSAVFGAILVVTGPTVVLPLLRQVRLSRRVANLLKWEAVVNDPLGALLTILVLEFLIARAAWGVGEAAAGREVLQHLVPAVAMAVGLAVAAAFAIRWMFHKDQVPEVLKTPLLLAGALGLYATGNVLFEEAGLLSATIFGLTLANLNIVGLRDLSRYKESLSVLLVSALFILLAADLDRTVIARLDWQAVALLGVVLVVVRPLAVTIATLGSGLALRERLLVGWVGPRGIVAAALAGVVGGRLASAGYAGADMLLPLVFGVIATTVLFHGLSLRHLARFLGLQATQRPGILVVGASPWTVELARTLQGQGVPVLLVDRYHMALHQARSAEIPTMAVEILSDWVEVSLDMGVVDYVFAATRDDVYNALVCARFAPELGRERVHQLAGDSGWAGERWTPGRDWRGKVVVGDLDFASANKKLAEGWRFVVHQPRAADEPVAEQGIGAEEKPLLTLRADGRIIFNTPERVARARPGDCVVTFRPPAAHDRQVPVSAAAPSA